MSWANKTYTFSPSTTAKSAEVNQNFDDMVDGLDVAMPSNAIVIWSGSTATIPTGWYLCDGNNSTPDLRNRFVIGAGDTYAVNDNGGSATINWAHTHTFSDTSSSGGDHYHIGHQSGGHSNDVGFNDGQYYVGTNNVAHTHTIGGTTGSAGGATGSVLNPYYALAYMMKS